LYFTSKQLSCL